MEYKRILVLANSFKHHARCVAGRELYADGTPGPWIRPVSNHGEGELLPHEMQLSTGRQVEVFQYVSIPLRRYANDRLQPENWLIHGAGNWLDMDASCPDYSPAILEECPRDLWEEPGRFADWASHGWLQSAPPQQSLYVIRPRNLRIRVENRDGKERWRAVFCFRGVGYNLSITDPAFIQRHSAWPRGRELPIEAPLRCEDHCLMCVSLGSFWQGKHYKLAATIFENV